jgi:broad specificity phosphatase PhoE
MIRYLLFITLFYGAQPESCEKKSDEIFTIYLIRHAEKNQESVNPADPELTPCGVQRAESIQAFFSSIELERVYSTELTRAKSTALPTANDKGLELNIYDSDSLADFAKHLLQRKQDALVVGHSNTTAVLAGLLVGEKLGELDLDIYDHIYQVVVSSQGSRLNLFHSNFKCGE